ncbi:MAG: arsenate reductase ArsC [Pseudomonadota bacterium]
MAKKRPFTVLVLCTGNSARSILAEGLFNTAGAGRIAAYSAGSKPQGTPHREALKVLEANGHETDFARSKSWDEFAGADSPKMDLIVTVCDNAAAEACPVWPGHPASAHWGLPDPAAAHGDAHEVRRAFESTYRALRKRVLAFVELPFEELDAADLARAARQIGSF